MALGFSRVATSLLTLGVLGTVVASSNPATAFSQKSTVSPSGHEWITVHSANEAAKIIAKDILTPKDDEILPKQPGWGKLDYFETKSLSVWSAVMGQRWVDIMGFVKEGSMTSATPNACLDTVAQLPDDIQYDHFLRKTTDVNQCTTAIPEGGAKHAINESVKRFEAYFVTAAAAGDEIIQITDGGATRRVFNVKKAYFLLGRALHLFEDSFSTEHSQRSPDGTTVYDIKSYLCGRDIQQHSHAAAVSTATDNGDVLWNSVLYSESSLKANVKIARSATAEVWARFMKAHTSHGDRAAAARTELIKIKEHWFKVDTSKATKAPPLGACSVPTQVDITTKREGCLRETGRLQGGIVPEDRYKPPYAWSSGFGNNKPDNMPCAQDTECASGACLVTNMVGMVAPGNQGLCGAGCDADSQCRTGGCSKIYGVCECKKDSDCGSAATCQVNYKNINKCIAKSTLLPNGTSCVAGSACQSGYCSWTFKCADKSK